MSNGNHSQDSDEYNEGQQEDSEDDHLGDDTQLPEAPTDAGYPVQPGMTNAELNTSIVYQGDRPETTTITVQLLKALAPGFYGLVTRTYGSRVQPYIPDTHSADMRCPLPMDFDRDAQEEDRMAHPTDETDAPFPPLIATNVELPTPIVVPAHDDRRTMPLMHTEMPNIDLHATEDEPDQHAAGNGDLVSEAAVDNSACNINPVPPVQSQDDVSSSDSDDEDRIRGSASDVVQNQETGSLDQREDIGETPSVHTNPRPAVHDEVPSAQAELPNVPPSETAMLPIDVRDTGGNVSNPTEGADQLIDIVTHTLPTPKPPTQETSNGALVQEHAN